MPFNLEGDYPLVGPAEPRRGGKTTGRRWSGSGTPVTRAYHREMEAPSERWITGRRWSDSGTCNTEPSQTGNPEGVTDTISRPPRSTRRPHSPFPRAPLLPRRSGLCYLTTFRRPFRAWVDWVCPLCRGYALSGFTACLWSVASPGLSSLRKSVALSGLHLIGCAHYAGVAPFRASPPACGLSPLRSGVCAPACGLSPFQGLPYANIPCGACCLPTFPTYGRTGRTRSPQ